MQNNGLIKVFAVLFGIVSIYQLSFTFITSGVEKEAKTYAEVQFSENEDEYVSKRDQAVASYLDSIGNESLYGFTTYKSAKAKELNKGLDLKGGINVILQVSVKTSSKD